MRKLLAFSALIVFVSACNKALDVKPVSTITNSSFWKTADDVTGAINGMYVDLRSEANLDLFVFGEARSGDMSSALAGSLGYDIYYNNTLNSSNPGPNWYGLYRLVNDANLILKYTPGIVFTSANDKNAALAQAFTMRAYAYFVMAKTWGGVPLRLDPTEAYDPKTIQKARTPVADIFSQVKSDLRRALECFPDNSYPAGRNRWSRPAANALKASVYLWTAKLMNGGSVDLDTALVAVDSVTTSDLALLDDYHSIFDYNNKGNKEVIMAVHYQSLESSDNYYLNMFFHSSNITPDLTPGERDTIGPVGSNSNSVWQVAKYVRDQFSPDDQRRFGTFYEVYTKEGDFYASIATKGFGDVQNGVRYFTDDVMLYRYGGVLLMKAEIENALGKDPSAEINMVRKRAYGTHFPSHVFVPGTPDRNDEAILKERLLELTTEGQRWWDLLRFGKAYDLVPSLAGKENQKYLLLFPIGQDVISREPLVTENQGW